MVGEVGSESAALRKVSASPPECVSPPMGLSLPPPPPPPPPPLPSPAGALLLWVWPLRLGSALDGGVDEGEGEGEGEGDGDCVACDENKVGIMCAGRRHDHDDDVAEELCDTESVESTTPACATPLLFSESAVLRAGECAQ